MAADADVLIETIGECLRVPAQICSARKVGLSTLSASGLDFVWGEDAWCYVVDEAKLIAEAARLVRRGGAA